MVAYRFLMASRNQVEKILNHAEQRLRVKDGVKLEDSLNLYKKFLKIEEHRLRILHYAGAGGHETASGRSTVIDVLLNHLFRTANEEYCAKDQKDMLPFGIIAIGGYGRSELCPCSDVDIMFLHDAIPAQEKVHPYVETIVERVLYMLWDIGIKVGHSTRSLSGVVRHANEDMQSKTALIESRLVVGDHLLYDRFRQTLIESCVRGHEEEYITARIEDQNTRHEKYGATVYLQEPNVKSGCGGLRDIQNLCWMALFKYGAGNLQDLYNLGLLDTAEHRQLENAYEFLLRVRNALHYKTGRAHDVISLSLQPRIAAEFGYDEDDLLRRTEHFMHAVYLHSRNSYLLTKALAERMAFRPPERKRFMSWFRNDPKPSEFDGFVLQEGILSAKHPAIFKEEPLRILRAFFYIQQHQAELSPALRVTIRQHLKLVNRKFQNSPEARDIFLGIMQHKGQVGWVLRQMHEVEFLGKFVPEFGRLTCLVQHEFFHRYTADEHTLQVIEHLDKIIDAPTKPHSNYRKIFQHLEYPHILYLSLLLHDVGKAANTDDHSEAGIDMANRVARRLKLSSDETQVMLFLVQDHLKLSMLSQRRDLDDYETIDTAVRIVKNEFNLDMLFLLTFADAAGTSIESWSDWKELLLWELYEKTKNEMAAPDRSRNILATRIAQLYREVSKNLEGNLALEEIYSHFELMPASYCISTSAKDIERHLLTIHKFFLRQQSVEKLEEALIPAMDWQFFPTKGYSELLLCTWDRFGLFSKICGALAHAELNILSAHIYTRTDSLVIDKFEVCNKQYQPVTDEKTIQSAELIVKKTLSNSGNINLKEILTKTHNNQHEYGRIREISIMPTVEFDNKISKNRTVIEVQAEDRIGLLFSISESMNELELDITYAKVSTEKGVAIDSFYVQNRNGKKIVDNDQLDLIRAKLIKTIS